MTEKYEIASRDRAQSSHTFEKKLNEQEQSVLKLSSECQTLKSDRDQRLIQHQQDLETERDVFKKKVHEVEKKAKEAESKKSLYLFEAEKNAAFII